TEKTYVKEVQIDTDFIFMFPDDYINNITERMNLYTELNKEESEAQLKEFEKHLIDRSGDLHTQAADLLNAMRMKWIATSIGVERVIMKRGKLICYFIADQKSKFYQTKAFTKVLQYVQTHPHLCTLKEKKTRNGLRLLLRFEDIKNIQQALSVLAPLDYKKEEVEA